MLRDKSTPLEKILGRLEDLDAANLTILVQRLARERKLLETVINTIREGILVINQKGVIEYANTATGKIIGLKPGEVGRASLWKLVPNLAQTLNISADGAYAEVSMISRELHLSYPENRYVRLYLVPFQETDFEEKEMGRRYAVILADITEEKLSTQEIIESEKISSILMLAAGVAHELGNPLNSLTIHLQLIQRELKKLTPKPQKDSWKIEDALAVCLEEVKRLDGIIAHFLEAVQPSLPDLQDLDLIAVLEEVLEFVGQELKDRHVLVDIEVTKTPPIISADHNQIKQVYFNILKNACEAMEGGGTIKVRARSDDESVYLQIGDTGKGIAKEDFSKVFQPYGTTKKDGHGLGMMIVQRIMRDHGGQIGIDSQPHRGTVVTLQFPQKHQRVRLLTD